MLVSLIPLCIQVGPTLVLPSQTQLGVGSGASRGIIQLLFDRLQRTNG